MLFLIRAALSGFVLLFAASASAVSPQDLPGEWRDGFPATRLMGDLPQGEEASRFQAFLADVARLVRSDPQYAPYKGGVTSVFVTGPGYADSGRNAVKGRIEFQALAFQKVGKNGKGILPLNGLGTSLKVALNDVGEILEDAIIAGGDRQGAYHPYPESAGEVGGFPLVKRAERAGHVLVITRNKEPVFEAVSQERFLRAAMKLEASRMDSGLRNRLPNLDAPQTVDNAIERQIAEIQKSPMDPAVKEKIIAAMRSSPQLKAQMAATRKDIGEKPIPDDPKAAVWKKHYLALKGMSAEERSKPAWVVCKAECASRWDMRNLDMVPAGTPGAVRLASVAEPFRFGAGKVGNRLITVAWSTVGQTNPAGVDWDKVRETLAKPNALPALLR